MIKLSLLASQTQPRSPSPTRSVSPKGSLSPSISQSPSGSLSGSLQQPLPASSIESLNLGGVYTSTRLSGDSVESPRSYVYPEEYPDVTCNLSNSAIVNKDATGGLKGSSMCKKELFVWSWHFVTHVENVNTSVTLTVVEL